MGCTTPLLCWWGLQLHDVPIILACCDPEARCVSECTCTTKYQLANYTKTVDVNGLTGLLSLCLCRLRSPKRWKCTPHQDLQGRLWRSGYERGALQGEMFEARHFLESSHIQGAPRKLP